MSTLSLKQQVFAHDHPHHKAIPKPPTLWVGVGRNGLIYHSADGEDWAEANPSTSDGIAIYEKVVSENGQFIAVGNRISFSATGQRWTTSVYFTDTVLRDIAFGNDTWVCVGHKSVALSSADNGKSWVHQQECRTQDYSGIAFGNGVFVAVGGTQSGTGFITLTSDVVTWKETLVTLAPLVTVVFGNGRFVAMDTQGCAHVSEDGIHWHRGDVALGTDIHALQYVNGSFLVGMGAFGYRWSIDGKEWSAETGYLPKQVIYGGAKYLGLSADGDLLSATIMDNWTHQGGAIFRFASLVHRTGDERIR